MSTTALKGRRCVGLTRCSTPGQTGTGLSNDQQLEILMTYAQKHEMVWMGEERAEGISGSQTHNRTDIENLLYRAEHDKDFDVLLVTSYDRLTRSGADHGAFLLFSFQQHGVEVISTSNDIPDNEYAPLIKSIEFIKGNGTAKAISSGATRGGASSLFDGRAAYTRQLPYGIDRLILSNTGRKLFRIRNLTDGTQQKLEWDSDTVIETYGRNPKKGVFVHFQKHVDQRIVLINGAPDAVRAVQEMFRLYYVEGAGIHSIAMELNGRGIPAPRGGTWNQSSVHQIVRNPIYIQKGIANRYAIGVYHNRPSVRGHDPVPAKKSDRKWRARPENEWYVTHNPDISIVPPDMYDTVWKEQLKWLRRRIERDKTPFKRDARSNTPYLLLGAIFDKETGEKLRGHRCGPERLHRYYHLLRDRVNPRPELKGRPKFFPAVPAEETVCRLLGEVLNDPEEYRPMLRKYAADRLREASRSGDLGKLIAQRESLRRQKAFALDEFGDIGEDLLRKKIAPLTAQIKALDDRISIAGRASGFTNGTADEIADAVLSQIGQLRRYLTEPVPATMRTIVNSFTRTVVDLPKKEADIEIRLPAAFVSRPHLMTSLCESSHSARRIGRNAQPQEHLVFARFRCNRHTSKQHACLKCRRIAVEDAVPALRSAA